MFLNQASEFVYTRTYSRWIDSLNRRETWEETVDRYIAFIIKHRGENIPPKVIKKIKRYLMEFEVMPSMRAMWAAGGAAEADNVTIFNCSFSKIQSITDFAESLYILMCGTGFGFSVSRTDVQNLPIVPQMTSLSLGTHTVEDSRSGWANSLKALIQALYDGKDLEMDYSLCRQKGARLKTMGGRSSGPAPLIGLHNFCRELFSKAQGRKLLDIEAHDLECKIAEIVVVGGVRRSSEISLSDLDSESMMRAKVFPFPPHRYMANNSAIYHKKPTAVEFLKEWSSLAASGSGERGIFNLEAAKKSAPSRRDASKIAGTNPCKPLKSLILTDKGYITFAQALQQEELTVLDFDGNKHKATKPFLTKKSAIVSRVTLSDGSFLYGTPDHRHKTEDGTWIKIEDMEIGTRLLRVKNDHNDMYEIDGEVVGIEATHSIEDVYDITVFSEDHYFIDNGVITHNCGEIMLRDKEFCNLSEVVIRSHDDVDTLLEKVETATWIGAIQSTFTYFPYLSEEWKNNCEEERLLGVSLTGQMDNPEILTPEVLRALKRKALKVAAHAAKKLGINMPAAVTCVKPSGTVSQLVDSSSGIHTRYSPYYIRRYRISSSDPLFKMLKDQGVPCCPEVGQTAETADTWVLAFPVKSPDNAITRNDLTALQQLEHYKKIQANWCEHNASATIYVKDAEWFEVGNWVYQNWDYINGVSFLPHDGGMYELAPYEEIDKAKYEELLSGFPKIDYSKLTQYELEDNTEGAKSLACVSGICEI